MDPTTPPKLTTPTNNSSSSSNSNHGPFMTSGFVPRRSRHISIGDASPNVAASSCSNPTSSSLPKGTGGYSKVKSTFQKAVRRMSGSSGGGSSNNSSNSGGSTTPEAAFAVANANGTTTALIQQSADKVNTAVASASSQGQQQGQQQRYSRPVVIQIPTQRSRHRSLNADQIFCSVSPNNRGGGSNVSSNDPARRRRAQRLHKAESTPLPRGRSCSSHAHHSHAPSDRRRASQPAPCSSVDDTYNDFPYSSAFAYTLVGKASPFPCGSEAVMINSSLAHDAFREYQTTMVSGERSWVFHESD